MSSKAGNYRFAFSFSLLCAICSCTYPKHLDIAKEKTNKYYAWVEQDHIDSVFTLFRKNYVLSADSLDLVKHIKQLKELGEMESRSYDGMTQETKIEKGKKTIYLTVKYKVKYSDGTILDEQFQYVTNDEYSDILYRINIGEDNDL